MVQGTGAMTRPVAILLIAGFALAGCASAKDIAREISDQDHRQCMSRGFESGSEGYNTCRWRLTEIRTRGEERRSVNTLMRKVNQPPGATPAGAAGAKAETPAVTALAANRTTAMAAPKPEPMPAATAAPADRGTAAKPVQLATLATLLPEMEARPKPGRFVVLGSYLKEANARDAMKRGHDFAPRMVRVRVHGKLFHRVVSGPYTRSSIGTMRRTLIGEGFPDAWTAKLCENTLRLAPACTENQG